MPETIKNVREEFRFDTHPGVFYDNPKLRGGVFHNYLYGTAVRRKFDSIGKKVPDYLLKAMIVT